MAKQTLKPLSKAAQPDAEFRIRKDCRSVFWYGGKPYRAGAPIYASDELVAEYPNVLERVLPAAKPIDSQLEPSEVS